MTLEITNRIAIHTGNGATTVFPYGFPVLSASDMIVSLQDATTGLVTSVLNPSEYSVTGIGNPDGGTVTYPLSGSPLASTTKIIIERLVEYKQPLELNDYGGFYPESVERQLDHMEMQIQQLAEQVGRSVIAAPGGAQRVLANNFTDNDSLMFQNGAIVPGPTASEISNAQGYAQAAAASAQAAADDLSEVETIYGEIQTYDPTVRYKTVADMLASTRGPAGVGAQWQAAGFLYTEADPSATDHHLTTAGGVKLYVRLDDMGRMNASAFGADGSHDSTAEVVAAAKAAAPRGLVFVAPNTTFDVSAALHDADWPIEVFLYGQPLIGFGYAGVNLHGFFTKGDPTAAKDSAFILHDGHNVGMIFSNDGSSGSVSGQHKIVTMLWSGGFMTKGAIPGLQQNLAAWQWGIHNDLPRWAYTLRKYAPPIAAEKGYFFWKEGVSVSIGDVCFNNNSGGTYAYYQATSAGTTGPTRPTHTAGSVSDGGVTWQFVSSLYDTSIYQFTDIGQRFVNAGASAVQFERVRMSPDDPATTMVFRRETSGPSKDIRYEFVPTDGTGTLATAWRTVYDTSNISFQYGATTIFSLDSAGVNLRRVTKATATAADGDTSPSVAAISSLVLNNSSATSISTFDNGATNQELEVIAQNANTTLTHGSGMVLKGATNAAMPANGVMRLRKVPYSSAWIEVSRSW